MSEPETTNEPPKQKLLFDPAKFNPPPRVGGLLMLVTGALLLKYELFDLAAAAQQLEGVGFQPLYSMLGGVLVALGALVLVFGEHADALLGKSDGGKRPSKMLLWILVLAPGLVAWGFDSLTQDSRAPALSDHADSSQK